MTVGLDNLYLRQKEAPSGVDLINKLGKCH